MTLTEFVLARISDRESVARDMRHQSRLGRPLLQVLAGGTGIRELVDPEHILAECEAMRKVLDALLHEEWFWMVMAAPHADHPDYRQEWKP